MHDHPLILSWNQEKDVIPQGYGFPLNKMTTMESIEWTMLPMM